jgi:hypothetical protein
MIRILVSCIALLISSSAVAGDSPSKVFPVQLFLQACVSSYAQVDAVSSRSKKMSLSEITGDPATKYLKGRSGRVWYGQNVSGAYAVSLLDNGLCSVFVHAGDAAQLRSAFESWLPPEETGITVAKEAIPASPGLTSTSYMLRGGNVRETWVLTVASAPEVALRAVMSYANQ